jgi:hypothetical protein
MYSISDMSTLKIIYFAYLHSVMEYGIIYCGNSSDSRKICHVQKKRIRIKTVSKPRDAGKPLFQTLEI